MTMCSSNYCINIVSGRVHALVSVMKVYTIVQELLEIFNTKQHRVQMSTSIVVIFTFNQIQLRRLIVITHPFPFIWSVIIRRKIQSASFNSDVQVWRQIITSRSTWFTNIQLAQIYLKVYKRQIYCHGMICWQ